VKNAAASSVVASTTTIAVPPIRHAQGLSQHRSKRACDPLTVETAIVQRIYVLFSISLATRRIEYVACTSHPDGGRVAQQARNLILQLGDEPPSGREPTPLNAPDRLQRRDLFGGLIHEYQAAA
jgi:hypothetical protein